MSLVSLVRSLREGGETNNVAEEDYHMLVRLSNELLTVLSHTFTSQICNPQPTAASSLQPNRPAATAQTLAECINQLALRLLCATNLDFGNDLLRQDSLEQLHCLGIFVCGSCDKP